MTRFLFGSSAGGHVATPVTIANGGTGQTAAQAAIDALTAVSGASTSQVLTKDGSGNASWATSSGITASSTDTFTNKTYTNLKMKLGIELDIVSGAVAVTQMWHFIDTESSASSDDLDNATGGAQGELLYLNSANSARDPTIKDSAGGNGAFRTASDFTLAQTLDVFVCMHQGNIADQWLEVSRSTN